MPSRRAVPFVHDIDPIAATIFGVHVWWYGLSYVVGFVNAHIFLRRNRDRLGLTCQQVYDLTLCLTVGVLVGGRAVGVFVNEWPFYREHPALIPALWIGGLATHGLIAGGAVGVFAFCAAHRLAYRPVLDALAVAATFILGCGRIGNFIDGQIVGTVTHVAWAVQFPDAAGFRHPVVLYDGFKNLMLVPVLLWARRRGAPPGRLAALFLLLYPALRMPIDLFRDYQAETAATGQMLNAMMATSGALLLGRNVLRRHHAESAVPQRCVTRSPNRLAWRRAAFAAALVLAAIIPSDSTRDIPARYGKRHPGLVYSSLYKPIAAPREGRGALGDIGINR